MPILNEAGVPQISPANTAVGLTSDEPGADQGEPDKYYPAGKRTYVRIVPKDTIQGAALATVMKEDGCTKVAWPTTRRSTARAWPGTSRLAAKAQGLNDHRQRGDRQERGELPLAGLQGQGRRARTASCSRASPPTTRSRSTRTSRRRCRTRSSTGRTASRSPASPTRRRAASPPTWPRKMKVTVATLSPDEYPPEGQEFFTSSRRSTARRTPTRTPSTATRPCASRSTRSSARARAAKEDILKALFDTKDR